MPLRPISANVWHSRHRQSLQGGAYARVPPGWANALTGSVSFGGVVCCLDYSSKNSYFWTQTFHTLALNALLYDGRAP